MNTLNELLRLLSKSHYRLTRRKYELWIKSDTTSKYIGTFHTEEEAISAEWACKTYLGLEILFKMKERGELSKIEYANLAYSLLGIDVLN